ncbi:MAG: EF2563 family selenium-dependent molybdenum hydroxylase system protein [Campylobacteraceae bacterium]|nr:EF2563 family selenium-dependent molybdenum hydroxylase system protein [Campylobacteraceae bacterium]
MKNNLVLIRGAGDIATGIAVRLFNSGFKIVMSEISKPSSIRRKVCFSEAIYDGKTEVENITCKKANTLKDINEILHVNQVAVAIDEKNELYKNLKPNIVVDAILAKKNLGTHLGMAQIVIGVGPGFEANKDCHCVVETSRGHDLGRVIYKGSAKKNTGIPGVIAGVSKERVIYSPNAGALHVKAKIGDIVKKNDIIAYVGKSEVRATIDGVLRGLLRDGYEVSERFKIADIDPRVDEQKNCFSISDKARSVGGGVLEAILHLKEKNNLN